MDIHSPFNRFVARLLIATLSLDPLLAGAAGLVVDPASGGTALAQAGNGVPIVNIAAPSAGGLSHNKFRDYDVGAQGLILNNATERTQSTQLGGLIVGNPNLSGRAAGIILNEVTGGNASRLAGYTEVAGQPAAVVVANPYGITCDGCGFINTPRVTLSTGRPLVDNGRLTGFDVDGGRIAIEGAGLNASNVDQFELITRSARINAALHAQRLDIVTGRNLVDAGDLSASAKAGNDGEVPLLAIDSSALGGMYAGAIRLIGTEAGVGVRLAGDLAVSTGDLRIDAGGKLSLDNAAAAGRIDARAAEIEVQGRVYAGARLDLASAGDLLLAAGGDPLDPRTLAAGGSVALDSGGTLVNRRHVEAGVNADGSRSADGDVILSAGQLRNEGSLLAGRDLRADVAGVLDNRGGRLIAERDASLATGHMSNGGGSVTAAGNLAIQGGALDNRQGRIVSGGTLDVRASALDQRGGQLFSQRGLNLNLNGGNLNNDDGLLGARQAARLQNLGAGSSNRGGEISSRETLSVGAAGLDNAGGRLLAEGALDLRGGRLANGGGLVAANGALTVGMQEVDNRGGEISTKVDARIDAGTFDNGGGTLLARWLDVAAGQLRNHDRGRIYGTDAARIQGRQLDNAGGTVASGRSLLVEADALINGGGLLTSEGSLSVAAGTLDNDRGDLSSAGALRIDVAGELRNRDGRILTEDELSLASASLDNRRGLVSAADAANVATGDIVNDQGRLLGKDRLDLLAGQVSSAGGRIASGGALTLRATGLNQRGGELFGQGGLDLDLGGGNLVNDDGLIHAPDDLRLQNLGTVSNRGGEISSRQGFALAVSSLDNAGGKLLTEHDLSVTVAGAFGNRAGVLSGDRLDLSAAELDNRQGEISALGALTANVAHLDNRAGAIIARDRLNLAFTTGDNRGGLLSGWQRLFLVADGLDNRDGGTLSSRSGDLDLQLSGDLLNGGQGALVAAGRLSLVADSLINRDGGILSSGGEQRLALAATLDNRGGQIDGGAAVDIDARHLDNRSGLLLARQALTVAATGLDNTGGRIGASAAARLDLSEKLTNAGGQLASAGQLHLVAGEVDNRGGTLASQSTATVETARLDNAARGTLAANGRLSLQVAGRLDNTGDGLIHSRDDRLLLSAATLDNAGGTLQGRGDLTLDTSGELINRNGRIVSSEGAVNVTASELDNRRGTLAALAGQVRGRLAGRLRNGTDGGGRGGVIEGRQIDIEAAGGIDNAAGRLAAHGGDARLIGSTLDNRGGELHAQGRLQFVGGTFDNRGGQVGAGTVDLGLTGTLDNRQGILESGGTLAVSAAALDNGNGRLRALGRNGDSTLHVTGLLDNRSGVLESANRNLTLNVGNLLNQNGRLLHAGDGELSIAMERFFEAGGEIATAGGLTLSAEQWSNSSTLRAGRLTLDIGSFTQTASGQILVGQSLTGRGRDWINHGLIASDGSIDLVLSGGYSGDGRLASVGDLALSAASLDLPAAGSIAAGGKAGVNVGAQATNLGRITAAGNLDFTAARLNNRGTLGSAEKLTLTMPDLLNEEGLIFSGADMSIHADRFINRHADVYSLNGLLIGGAGGRSSAERVENRSGTIESAGNMSIRAYGLENTADVFEVSRRMVSGHAAARCIDCKHDYYTMDYFVREQYQTEVDADAPAHITAGGNFSFAGSTFANRLSTLSAAGDISIETGQFSNEGALSGTMERTRLLRHENIRDKFVAPFVMNQVSAYNRRNNPDFPNAYYVDGAGNLRLAIAFVATIPPSEWEGETYQLGFKDAQTGQPVAITFANYTYLPDDKLPQSQYDPNNLMEFPVAGNSLTLLSDLEVFTASGAGQAAVIQAGGRVSIVAGEHINNGVISHDYTHRQNIPTQGGLSVAPATTVIQLNPQLPPDLARQQVNPLSLPGFSLPTGQNGLFRLSSQGGGDNRVRDTTALELAKRTGAGSTQGSGVQVQTPAPTPNGSTDVPRAGGVVVENTAPKHNYLIETNPALTDLKQFMSSDYLLGLLGYDPDLAQKRLGDGLYEQRLLREAVLARTGERYLAGLTSDEAMFRHLMDNAIASKDALGLALGVSLSAEQVAALTHDIVWLESYEVMGEQVLVPVLYLAQAEGRLAPNGALIQGGDVSLIAGGDLNNRGTLRADGSLQAVAANIDNGGLIEAGERLQLLADDNIVNAWGGIIAGRDVSLIAGEDIINARSVSVHESALGDHTWTRSFVDDAARIEATGSLGLAAGRDVTNLGGVLESRGDLGILAGRDVNIASVQDVQGHTRGTYYAQEQITQIGATVSAGGDLAVAAGNDLTVIGSAVRAEGNVSLDAGNDLTIASAANESHDYSRTKKVIVQQDQVRQQESEITAGGSMDMSAGNDLTLVSSRVNAGREAYLVAGNDINLLAAQNYDYSLYQKKKKGSFGKKSFKRDEVTEVTNVGSEIATGGDLVLASGGDQTYQAAKLDSGGDIALLSGGDIAFEGVKDLKQESHEKSKSSWAWQSMKGQGTTDEALVQSQVEAVGELAIRAAGNIRIDIKEVNAQTIGQTIDAMVAAEPGLAWLKEMEQRGDVDWHQVKEIHDSFKYSHSGLGGVAAVVIAIIVAYFTAGAASSAIGSAAGASAGSGTAMAAGTAATATTQAVAAGWANAALSAVAGAAASTATISAINNKGDLGAVLKDVTSGDALKGYVASVLTAGLTQSATSHLQQEGLLAADLGSASFGDRLAAYATRATIAAGVQSAVVGKPLDEAMTTALVSSLAQALTSEIGDWGRGSETQIAKALAHAAVQCASAKVQGGDCGSAAVGAATAELLSPLLNDLDGRTKAAEFQQSLGSMVAGVGAALVAGLMGKDAVTAANAAQTVDYYNRQLHPDQVKGIDELSKKGGGKSEDLTAVLCVLQNCDINGLSGVDQSMQDTYKIGVEILKNNPTLFQQLAANIQSAGLLSGEFEYNPGNFDFVKDAIGLRLQNSIYTPFDKVTTRPENWTVWLTGAAKGLGNLNPDLQVPAPMSSIDEERGAIWGKAAGIVAAAVAGHVVARGMGAGVSASGATAVARNFAVGSEPNLAINLNQQNKHIVGTNEHKTASQITQRSTLAPDIDPQMLINQYAGTGQAANRVPLGQPGSVERITTNQSIGVYYENGVAVGPTKNFTIRYAKDGVHIIPARP